MKKRFKRKPQQEIEYLKPINPNDFDPELKIIKGSLGDCLHDIASFYDLDFQELYEYANFDEYVGFNEGYPVGSITRSEGQIMFALIRVLGMKNVLEIGTFYGCSTNHLAAALKLSGKVVSIDNKADLSKIGSLIAPELKPYISLITGDLFVELPKIEENSIDLIFEDSAHLEETTRFCLEQARRILVPDGWIIVHDTLCSTHVKKVRCRDRVLLGIARARMYAEFRHYVVDNSTYGLGVCRVKK